MEVGLTAYDIYTAVQTSRDPNASLAEKGSAITFAVAGLALPAGGYGKVAKTVLNKVDDVAKISSKYNWGSAEKLLDHFQRHGEDFRAKDAADYAKKANNFSEQFGKQGIDAKVDPSSGDVLMYEARTNTFGSYNQHGQTKTFYKPDPAQNGGRTGQQYFNDQRGRRVLQ